MHALIRILDIYMTFRNICVNLIIITAWKSIEKWTFIFCDIGKLKEMW